jgi:hypothetical protein
VAEAWGSCTIGSHPEKKYPIAYSTRELDKLFSLEFLNTNYTLFLSLIENCSL